MIKDLVLGKIVPDEFLKTEKKKASSNESLINLALKLYSCCYQGAFECITGLRKQKKISLSSDFKILNAYYCIYTSQFKEASGILSELSASKDKCDKELISHMKVTLLLEQRLFEEARVFLSKLERTEQVSLKLIYCYMNLNDTQSAINVIKDDKLNYPEAFLYYKLSSLIIKKKFSKALEQLDTQNSDENYKEDWLILRSFLHLQLNQLSQSCQILIEVLESNNKSKIAWHLISIVYYKLEFYSDSFWSLSKCLHFNPESPEYLHNLSKLYEKTLNFSIAKGLSDKVKKIDPNFNFQEEFFYPIIDFSEFGNRRKFFIPAKVACKEEIFVKPIAKKVNAPKKKRKMAEVEEEKGAEYFAVQTLESMKASSMSDWNGQVKGSKKGFMPTYFGNS